MTESVGTRVGAAPLDQMSSRQLAALLVSIQADLAAMRAYVATHQHSALNAAPTTQPAALNTLP